MPRTEVENQRIRDEQREKILEAAMRIFARKGLAGTKMADIAAAAHVSYGLAYHYFTNKETIFAELAQRALNGSSEIAREALTRSGTTWDKLRWLTEQMLEGLQERPEYILIILQVVTSEAVPAELRENVRRVGETSQTVRQLIIEGQAAGQVRAGNPDKLLTTFMSCIQGLSLTLMMHDQGEALRQLPTVEMVLSILKA